MSSQEDELWPPPSGLHNAVSVASSPGGLCRFGGKGKFSRN